MHEKFALSKIIIISLKHSKCTYDKQIDFYLNYKEYELSLLAKNSPDEQCFNLKTWDLWFQYEIIDLNYAFMEWYPILKSLSSILIIGSPSIQLST